MKKRNCKWLLCAGLAAIALTLIFVLPAYSFSGYFLLGAAALIPVYHLLRGRKLPRRILTGLLAVLVAAMAITGGFIVSTADGRGTQSSPYLIVLGCQVNGTEPSLMLRQRLDAAVEYLNANPNTQCVVTGGKGNRENISEAECMYTYLVAAGIAPQRIWMEDRATSTIENLRNSVPMIEAETGQRPEHITILSSEFHLFRAGLMASDLGLTASLTPASTDHPTLLANYFLREIFAVWKYCIFGG